MDNTTQYKHTQNIVWQQSLQCWVSSQNQSVQHNKEEKHVYMQHRNLPLTKYVSLTNYSTMVYSITQVIWFFYKNLCYKQTLMNYNLPNKHQPSPDTKTQQTVNHHNVSQPSTSKIKSGLNKCFIFVMNTHTPTGNCDWD